MTDADLDQCYSAVCEALTRVGEAQAPLFLSMLCLSLITRQDRADGVLPLIADAQTRCGLGER
ncbi:hypothetical protein [Hydrogenophaga sp.]|uniref:hypothetical protein n=1 Tax=Hydrogenophaga sp. TaxID=1904254 RepID=UPI00261F64BF|nr:hypothetical protein [Hydrogenophaga sp.]MCW5652218.1 hypothetical protein [Hydrogenophaga sp.]